MIHTRKWQIVRGMKIVGTVIASTFEEAVIKAKRFGRGVMVVG